MKTVLLLGGYGFLGSNVMKYVDAHANGQYSFIVFDKYPVHQAGLTFDCIERVYAGDFSDRELLTTIFKENRIDIVLHSLSTTIPVDSKNARYDVETNLLPTLDVLSLMVRYKVFDIVYLSSGGAIYGTNTQHQHIESDDVFPVSSYGVVKLTIEKYIMQYAQLYGLRPLILRLSNPYGPYHYGLKQGVVNVAVDKALHGECLDIWGDGNGKKDYIYVDDYANILLKLVERKVYGSVINIASGETLTVNEIFDAVQMYVPTFTRQYVADEKYDTTRFELNTNKLKSLIGEYKFMPFQEGLHKTYEWAKEYYNL